LVSSTTATATSTFDCDLDLGDPLGRVHAKVRRPTEQPRSPRESARKPHAVIGIAAWVFAMTHGAIAIAAEVGTKTHAAIAIGAWVF
jgi:hypothetical protein